MTWEKAMAYAIAEARATGYRQRVYKSIVLGWWRVVQLAAEVREA